MKFILSLCLFCISGYVLASEHVKGSAVNFRSPNGIQEQCIILKHIPGGVYSYLDKKIEHNHCAMNIYRNTGICPKTWSTSPATIFYPLQCSKY